MQVEANKNKQQKPILETVETNAVPASVSAAATQKSKATWSNSMYASDLNGSKFLDIEGVVCLVVDKQCMTDEEGMRDLISLLQKNKSKIEGIVITDFEGSFKIDYFKRIELSLVNKHTFFLSAQSKDRGINKLKTIIINNSNLTREHIQILRNIIWWRREQIEKILLSKNSMDSLDFNDLFVQEDFNVTDITNLRSLEIRVQPGINKLTKTQFTEFTSLLVKQNESQQKQIAENEKQGIFAAVSHAFNSSMGDKEKAKQLYISLDETSLNHQNKKMIRMHSDTMSSLHLDEAYTNDKLFFSLNLGGCFQDRNESALRYFGEYLLAENFDDIVSLSFSKTQLKTIDNWIPVFTFLKKTKSVLELDLSDCSLQDRVIMQLFSQNLAIKSLDLSNNNNISMAGWKRMAESVICNPKSVTDILKLNNCYFEEAEVEELSRMIKNFAMRMQKNPMYLCALQKLYLNYNPQVSAKSLRLLTSSIFTLAKRSLETIEFRDCALNAEKLSEIINAMKSSFTQSGGNQLDEVVLRNNPGLANAQVELQSMLSFLMHHEMMIKKIDIGSCGVTSLTIEKFSESYLLSHRKLQQLVFKNNPGIDAAGYTAIAKHFLFSESSQLDKLDISNNSLTSEKLSGFLQIAEQFLISKKVNKTFERLLFKQNNSLEAECFDRVCKLLFFSQAMRIKKLSLKNSLNNAKVAILVALVQQILVDSKSIDNYRLPCLEDIALDKNNQLNRNSLVDLLEVFLIQNNSTFVFPHITRVQLSYCNICDRHAKELLARALKNKTNEQQQQPTPQPQVRALKVLNLEGNTCLTSNGWMMIAYLIFRTGYFENLEKLDLTYCKLEETGVSQICTQFQLSLKEKNTSFKHPLKELVLDKNSLLESSDLITVFDTFIFSPSSQITRLSIANSSVDSRAMQHLIKGVSEHIVKETEKGFFDNNRLPLINLNLSGNDTIDDVTWKQFIKVFILNKQESVELTSEIEALLKKEKEERQFVGQQFQNIVDLYKEKITRLSIPNKLPVFSIQELNLRGTTGLESYRWVEIFQKLIFTKQSQIRKLGLSSTFIEQRGWGQIVELLKNYETNQKNNSTDPADILLKLKEIDFSENLYLEPPQWNFLSQNLFFNTTVIQLELLNMTTCRITQAILTTIIDAIKINQYSQKPFPKLLNWNLNRNNIESLAPIEAKYFPDLVTLSLGSNQLSARKMSNKPLQEKLKSISLTIDSSENVEHLTKEFKETLESFPKLDLLVVRGFQPYFIQSSIEIFELMKTYNIGYIDFASQHMNQTDLFQAIFDANTFMGTFNFTSGFMLSQQYETYTEEQLNQINSAYESQITQMVGAIASKEVKPTLEQLDLSSLYGDYSEDTENIVMDWLMTFIGKCCSSLVSLRLKKCLILDQSLMNFCKEYAANKAFKLQEISLANNLQYTNEAWSDFFEHVLLCSEKNSLRLVEIGGNSFNAETFEILAQKAKRMSGKIEIERFHIDNIINIPAQTWTQHFFQGFVMLDSIKIKFLYIDRSLSIDSYNAVYTVINAYSKDSACSLRNVFGYYDIEQLFYQLYETQERTINLKANLDQASQLTVRDLWKKGLVTPSVTSIDCDSSLSEDFVNAIPEMTLDFVQDLLVPMHQSLQLAVSGTNPKNNQIAVSSNKDKTYKTPQILCLDYETIICLQRYFNLTYEETNNHPSMVVFKEIFQLSLAYPYNIILQPRLSGFLSKKTVFTHIYFIQHRFFDVIDTRQIYMLYMQLKDTQIDSIIIDYDLRQVDLPANLSERGLISLIRLFPPKSLGLDNVSINALKAIYSILASNSNFRYANVNFSSKSFINNGIAFSLREQLFTGKKRRNFILRVLGSIAYSFLNVFCVEAEVYKFDQSIPILNEELKQNRVYFNLMMFLTFVYYAICVVIPYILTRSDGNYYDKSTGVATFSHVIYAIFALISMIVEIVIYRFAYSRVKHLLPMLINVNHLDKDDRSIFGRIKMFFKNRMKLLEWLSYIFSLVISQIDRFDLYSDVCFIVICFKQDFFTIGLISLAVIASQLGSNVVKLFYLLLRVFYRSTKRLLNTHEINQFCEISNLLEFEALNNILDTVAPYNISFIPNNFLFRFIMPSAAGQSISNRLFVSMQKFLLEDAIQIVLQVAFVFQQDQGDSTVIISIVTSVFSIIKAFYKFMSIRPSTTSQLDFDFLSKLKRSQAEQHKITLTEYRDNMLSNIKIAIDSYVPATNITIKDSEAIYREEKVPLKSPIEDSMIGNPKKI